MTSGAILPQELIRRKRDGGELDAHEIEWFVRGITDGGVSDAQIGAFAMAVVLKGMTRDERVALTGAMMRSGEVLDWSEAGLQGPALDKHSTGGVGDKVSLLLAPIVAACGGRAGGQRPGDRIVAVEGPTAFRRRGLALDQHLDVHGFAPRRLFAALPTANCL